jgi:hypothetical protein
VSAGIDPIPPGGRLLHIGPHKTGTTAIQRALQAGRETLAEQHSVLYPSGPSQIRAAVAVTGASGLVGARQPSMSAWNRLVREVTETALTRSVTSSEFFDMADDETAVRIVEELGGERVHVVITVRPIAKLLASSWQQSVRARQRLGYEPWLEALFARDDRLKTVRSFWWRQRHDELVRRWVAAAATDRVTVLVVDETDPSLLLRRFEELLALPSDTLAVPPGSSNRSLTYAETEVIRELNQLFHKNGWSAESYARFVRDGAVDYLQHARRPSRSEPRIVTPQWALDRAAEIGKEIVAGIEASGVRVIGDLSSLAEATQAKVSPTGDVPRWAIKIAAQAAAGVMTNTEIAELQREVVAATRVYSVKPVVETTSLDLLKEVARRGRRRVRRLFRRTETETEAVSESEE